VGGGLQLNWRQRKRARALTTEKGESYERNATTGNRYLARSKGMGRGEYA
jgi:hypothetical protein